MHVLPSLSVSGPCAQKRTLPWLARNFATEKTKIARKRARPVYDVLVNAGGSGMDSVRPARLEDAKAIARIEVDTWRSTYAGMLPDRVLLNMSERRQTNSWASFLRHRPEDVWVAQHPQHGVIGFGNCGTQRDGAVDYSGEVYTLYAVSYTHLRAHETGRNL